MTKSIPSGFYYHYKHDGAGMVNNYAYEILGLARHSEDKTHMVTYRPLYENTYLGIASCSVRPLDMFLESVQIGWFEIPRFHPITDPKIIAELTSIRDQMYTS